MAFPFDIFEQAFQGNWVAWYGIATTIGLVGFLCLLIIVWWKMPQLAKSQFFNNMFNSGRPTIAQCHEDKKVRFMNPEMFSNGFAYAKGLVYIPPKQWLGSRADLKPETQALINTVYTIEGTPSPFYINWATSAAIMNPELEAMIEHEEEIQKLNKGEPVKMSREVFINVLRSIKDDVIQVKPLYLHFPLADIRNLKQLLPKSLSKSEFREFENKVRQDERGNKEGMNLGTIAIILSVITLVVSAITCLKVMGVF